MEKMAAPDVGRGGRRWASQQRRAAVPCGGMPLVRGGGAVVSGRTGRVRRGERERSRVWGFEEIWEFREWIYI